MAVLADADEGHVDGRGGSSRPTALADELRVLLAVEQVGHRDARGPDQPLLQILPEARRMRRRHPEILIEMEQLDLCPGQIAPGDERFEKLELRGAGGRDDAGFSARGDGVGYEFGGGGSSGPAHAGRVVEEADVHDGRTLARPARRVKVLACDELQDSDDGPGAAIEQQGLGRVHAEPAA